MLNLNINAEEFVPCDNSNIMMEMKMFDDLEKDFVKMNEWLFDYCPLNDIADTDETDEIEFIYECYKYDEIKFKNIKFKPALETIYENASYA